jgi:riboflavin synthase
MFTGIVEKVGKVVGRIEMENYLRMSIQHDFLQSELREGESIACDGACLTIVELNEKTMTFDISQETLCKTTLGSCQIGTKINLERALKAGDRLDGHFVSGHIDDRGSVRENKKVGMSLEMGINFDASFEKWIVTKGSIALNGVSLTVNETGKCWFKVNLIPFTMANTNLGQLKIGQKVNLEYDLIGKYATKFLETKKETPLTFAKLEESGW